MIDFTWLFCFSDVEALSAGFSMRAWPCDRKQRKKRANSSSNRSSGTPVTGQRQGAHGGSLKAEYSIMRAMAWGASLVPALAELQGFASFKEFKKWQESIEI